MSIRSTAKALIIHDGKILLNKCRDSGNGEYYSLPGGGQNQYETLFEAVVRECREETGYRVQPLKLVGVCEEICLDGEFRKERPNYAHKIYHFFRCALISEKQEPPTETDSLQTGSTWIDIEALGGIRLLPKALGERISDVISDSAPMFLGSEHIQWNHG